MVKTARAAVKVPRSLDELGDVSGLRSRATDRPEFSKLSLGRFCDHLNVAFDKSAPTRAH
jgi:hypothetical protein